MRIAYQNALHQVAELIGSELISFEIGDQIPIAINHQSVEGVGHQPFVWPETDAEPGAELLDLVGGAGQQVLALWIRVPGLAILRHHFGRVVGRFECNCQ
jgi:hypothetical protein